MCKAASITIALAPSDGFPLQPAKEYTIDNFTFHSMIGVGHIYHENTCQRLRKDKQVELPRRTTTCTAGMVHPSGPENVLICTLIIQSIFRNYRHVITLELSGVLPWNSHIAQIECYFDLVVQHIKVGDGPPDTASMPIYLLAGHQFPAVSDHEYSQPDEDISVSIPSYLLSALLPILTSRPEVEKYPPEAWIELNLQARSLWFANRTDFRHTVRPSEFGFKKTYNGTERTALLCLLYPGKISRNFLLLRFFLVWLPDDHPIFFSSLMKMFSNPNIILSSSITESTAPFTYLLHRKQVKICICYVYRSQALSGVFSSYRKDLFSTFEVIGVIVNQELRHWPLSFFPSSFARS